MRLSRLLVPAALAALCSGLLAQTPPPPAQNPDLPTVIKPKGAPVTKPKEEEQPQIDLNTDEIKQKDEKDLKEGADAAQSTDSSGKGGGGGAGAGAGPDYTGPSILSRGMNFTRPAIPANEKFRPFLGANFYRDSGVSGKYQGPLAPVTEQTFTGADFSWGLSGTHTRRFDAFQLDYRGHAYLNGYSSQDHALSVGYERVLTRRLTVNLSEAAGLYSNNYAVLNSVATTDTSIGNTALVVTPNTESFDDRTYYTTTQADVTYQRTSRLSVDFGASGFLVKRATNNLISANGYQARTDVAYRVTKRSTLGPYYAYSRYYYSGTFGDSDINTVGLNYSLALSKRTQLRFRGGVSRLETRGLQVVVLAPLVAQILGVSTGTQRYYAVTYSPDFAIDLSRNFQHSSVSLSYLKGVSPGNGVILTSNRDSVTVSYTYSGLRRYAVTIGGGRDALSSVAQEIGNYSSYFGRVSISRTLAYNVQALLNFDYRKLGFSDNVYARDQYRISIGFAFAPGARPLRFW